MGSNANSGYNAFIGSLESLRQAESISDFPKLIFIYGKSEFLLYKAATLIQTCWNKYPAAECVSYDGNELDEDLFSSLVGQQPMFGANLLYLIKRAETCRSLADYFEPLKSAASLKNHLCIVMKADKALDTLLKEVKKINGFILHAVEPAPFEFNTYIDYVAKRAGVSFAPDAKNMLVENLGKNVGLLDNEIQRLASIFDGRTAPLRSGDIAPYLGLLKEDFAITVRNYLLAGKNGKAHAIVADLLARGESGLAILGILAKHSRTAIKFAKSTPADVPGYLVSNYRNYFNRVGIAKLKQALNLCINGDRLLKSKRVSEELVLSQVVDSLS
jgi:DNA polymerase III delta subunit